MDTFVHWLHCQLDTKEKNALRHALVAKLEAQNLKHANRNKLFRRIDALLEQGKLEAPLRRELAQALQVSEAELDAQLLQAREAQQQRERERWFAESGPQLVAQVPPPRQVFMAGMLFHPKRFVRLPRELPTQPEAEQVRCIADAIAAFRKREGDSIPLFGPLSGFVYQNSAHTHWLFDLQGHCIAQHAVSYVPPHFESRYPVNTFRYLRERAQIAPHWERHRVQANGECTLYPMTDRSDAQKVQAKWTLYQVYTGRSRSRDGYGLSVEVEEVVWRGRSKGSGSIKGALLALEQELAMSGYRLSVAGLMENWFSLSVPVHRGEGELVYFLNDKLVQEPAHLMEPRPVSPPCTGLYYTWMPDDYHYASAPIRPGSTVTVLICDDKQSRQQWDMTYGVVKRVYPRARLVDVWVADSKLQTVKVDEHGNGHDIYNNEYWFSSRGIDDDEK